MKSKYKILLSFVCGLLLCSVFFVNTAFGLTWNGASSANSGGGTASTGYGVETNGSALVGFRFSLVDASNVQLGNSIDIFTGAKMDTTSELSTAKKMTLKKSKAFWVSSYSSISNITTTTDNTNCYVQADMTGFATNLPVSGGLNDGYKTIYKTPFYCRNNTCFYWDTMFFRFGPDL